jgi:hypothetical protein
MQEEEGEAGYFDDEIMDEEVLSEDQAQNVFDTQIREDCSSDQDNNSETKTKENARNQRKNKADKTNKKGKKGM